MRLDMSDSNDLSTPERDPDMSGDAPGLGLEAAPPVSSGEDDVPPTAYWPENTDRKPSPS